MEADQLSQLAIYRAFIEMARHWQPSEGDVFTIGNIASRLKSTRWDCRDYEDAARALAKEYNDLAKMWMYYAN